GLGHDRRRERQGGEHEERRDRIGDHVGDQSAEARAPQSSGRGHVFRLPHPEDLGADDPGRRGPGEPTDRQREGEHVAELREDRHHDHGREDVGDREEDVADAREHRVDPSSVVPRERPHDQTDA
ncbi:hypothetical protein ABE10_11555, partial [Bacillus toyonensis]|nr:hypothetical protein [Bacillus toyonensis]